MNTSIIHNYSKLSARLFIFPALLLGGLVIFLYAQDSLNTKAYIDIQQGYFFSINARLSAFPHFIYNLTQLGDALVFLSCLSLFLVYAPVLWESLLSVSLITLIVSSMLKNFFAVPRPAAVFEHTRFHIIGETLPGHSSLPSGHSITVFTTLTVLLFAFMPQKLSYKIVWVLLILLMGLSVAFTRVGVGAHYPLDVLVGGTVGYVCGLAGIFFSRRVGLWSWMKHKKYYPILFLLLLTAAALLITKTMQEPLPVFFMALGCLAISLYQMTHVYFKK